MRNKKLDNFLSKLQMKLFRFGFLKTGNRLQDFRTNYTLVFK